MTHYKLKRIDWHKHGNCWSPFKITVQRFYLGNMVVVSWWRLAVVFERRKWIVARWEKQKAKV